MLQGVGRVGLAIAARASCREIPVVPGDTLLHCCLMEYTMDGSSLVLGYPPPPRRGLLGRAAGGHTTVSRRSAMAMRDITDLMNAYRECSRNLWNIYFAKRDDIGGSLDAFEQIRELLFDSLVMSELSSEGDAKGQDVAPPALKVVPRGRSLILIRRLSGPGEAGYWDQEKDMVVGPDDITLAFADYFDFSQVPIKDFRYFLCKILRFPRHGEYEGREALLEVSDASVFHDERPDQKPKTACPSRG